MWRDCPRKAAAATGCAAVVYSRYGYGQSEVLSGPRAVDYMHVEALEVLPELLERLGIGEPVLVGHSDGGSIAPIYAAMSDGVKGRGLMRPHVFVEGVSVKSISQARTAVGCTALAH